MFGKVLNTLLFINGYTIIALTVFTYYLTRLQKFEVMLERSLTLECLFTVLSLRKVHSVRFYHKTQNDIERKPHSFFRDFTICFIRFPFNIPIPSIGKGHVQLSFTCLKSTIETLEKSVTLVQS